MLDITSQSALSPAFVKREHLVDQMERRVVRSTKPEPVRLPLLESPRRTASMRDQHCKGAQMVVAIQRQQITSKVHFEKLPSPA
jgi:hypothetical protein